MSISKAIEQVDPTTGEVVAEFHSIRAAARKLGINKELIRQTLGKPHRRARGYRWKLKDMGGYEGAKILLLDIETAPSEAYVWGLWNQDIYIDQVISDWYMLTWAAKWLYSDEVESDRLTGNESIINCDQRILESLWELIDKADIVIGHNLDRFDIPRIKTRFLLNDIEPPSFFRQIDTLKVARKEFNFSSNKLDYLAKMLGVRVKNGVTFDLWKSCREGNDEALETLREYNIQDVKVLEDVYLKLRPYIKGHPNLDLYIDDENSVCPNCGSNKLASEPDKYVYTQAVRYEMFRCGNCFAISRAKKGTPYENKKKISAIPR